MPSVMIPFSGFYESSHMHEIDREIENYFDKEGDGENHVPDNFYFSFKHYRDIEIDYCKLYCRMFEAWFEDQTGIKLPLEFEEMTSPREYSFATDRIFCLVPMDTIKEIFDYTPLSILKGQIEETYTSYDGFHSYYSNKLADWLEKPLDTWDHNELYTLLCAALYHSGVTERGWEYDVMECAMGNGLISDIVYPYVDKWVEENPYEADTGLKIKEFFDIPDKIWDDMTEEEKDTYNEHYQQATYHCQQTGELPL